MWRDDDGQNRLMTQAEGEALGRRIIDLVGEKDVEVRLQNWVNASTAFARGDAHVVKEEAATYAQIVMRGVVVGATRFDDEGLAAVIKRGKEAADNLQLRNAAWEPKGPKDFGKRPKLFWDEVLPAMRPAERNKIFNRALDGAEAVGLIAAGNLEFNTSASLLFNNKGLSLYGQTSYGEFSLTARTKDGTGSGWGWSGFEEWSRVDVDGVIKRAIDLAERSAKPVAVEPGRYTVILEPTATATLVSGIDWMAKFADEGATPFSKNPFGTNKIGLQVLDKRIDVTSDPWDPDMPFDTVDHQGDPVNRVLWIDNGYLRELYYHDGYAQEKHREPTLGTYSYMRWMFDGPKQSLEEMIANTKRGVWVNRLSGAFGMNGRTSLMSGTTRDGTFLIENGKITKAIKNFRFTESPFFVLNKLEAFGESVRAARMVVAPRVKVRDFDFTSLTDAV